MIDSPSTTMVPSRRTITRGLVWSMPVIAIAGVLPTATASTSAVQVANHGAITTLNNECGTTTVDGTATSGVAQYGLRWSNVSAVTTPITVGYYFNATGLTFPSQVVGWSALTQTTTSKTVDGRTYYLYTSTYSGTVTIMNGTAALTYKFGPTNCGTPPTYFEAVSSSVVNGQTFTTDSGILAISAPHAAAGAKTSVRTTKTAPTKLGTPAKVTAPASQSY
ncbi:hypothetical protein V3G39_00040 (plasmid) [Dermatophilaceae bacterium Sec6.4]